MLDFYIIINSHDRELMLMQLLSQIGEMKGGYRIKVKVYLDGCEYGFEPERWEEFETVPKHGRMRYYKLIQKAYSEIEPAKYYLKLDDDIVLVDNFFNKCIHCWNSNNEDGYGIPCTMNLLKDNRTQLWGALPPIEINDYITNTDWVDMIFMCDKRYFELISRLDLSPPVLDTSSGVARQITRYLRIFDAKMYQVNETLVHHIGEQSKMNPGLVNRGF